MLNEERLKGIVDEAYRDITVRDWDRNVTIPMAQAVVRYLAVNAARGLHRSQRLFAEMLATTERQNKELEDEWFSTALDYKIEWERELDRRKRSVSSSVSSISSVALLNPIFRFGRRGRCRLSVASRYRFAACPSISGG